MLSQHLDAVADAHAEADAGQTAHHIEHRPRPNRREVDAPPQAEEGHVKQGHEREAAHTPSQARFGLIRRFHKLVYLTDIKNYQNNSEWDPKRISLTTSAVSSNHINNKSFSI